MNELSLTQVILADSNIKWDEDRLNTYRHFMAFYNCKYKDIVKILYHYYKGKPISEETFNRMVIQHQDIIEKTLNRLTAGIYDKKPKRELVKSGTKWDGLDEILEKVKFHDKMYESFHKASFVNLVEFYPAMRDDKIAIDILTPDTFLVQVSSKSYLDAEKFLLIRIDENGNQYLVYWDKETHYLYSAIGDHEPVEGNEKMINPYGELPLTELRLKEGCNYFGEPDWNLFLNQMAIDIDLSEMDFAGHFQRIGILHGINTKFADGIKISPADILQTESKVPSEQVSLQFLNSNTSFQDWKDGIDWKIKSTLSSKGIVGSSASTDTSVSSGFSKEMDEISLKENRDKTINKLIDYEKRAFEKLRIVWNYHVSVGDLKDDEGKPLAMIPTDYEYVVVYPDYEPTLSPSELKVKREMQKQYYIKDEINFIMEDLGLTEEKAIEHFNNLKQRATELGLNPKQTNQTGLSLKDRLNNAAV